MDGFEEKSRADIKDSIAARTHLTVDDWLFSIARREYDRDDFIPTLNPAKIPKLARVSYGDSTIRGRPKEVSRLTAIRVGSVNRPRI